MGSDLARLSATFRLARRRVLTRVLLLSLCTAGLLGCLGVGQIDSGPAPGALPPGEAEGAPGSSTDPNLAPAADVESCARRAVPTQPLRRLSSTQWLNTLRDLLGRELASSLLADSAFPRTRIDKGFINDAEANTVNTAESNAIEDEAERIANRVLADPAPFVTRLMPCDLEAGYADSEVDACVDEFIERFGLRAYRRPLTASEQSIVRALYDAVRAEQSADDAFAALLQFFVQSPALLYRVERGAGEVAPGLLRLGDYEMASRLSYFLLDSMPDEELFEAAAAGELSTAAQVAVQARRLMDEPAFREVLAGFHRDWLHLHALEDAAKDPAQFPELTPALRASLQQEASRLLQHVLEEGSGSLAELLGSDVFAVDDTLAAFYGVDAPSGSGDPWQPVELPRRKGLLTTASFMASHADASRTSPIHRGVFIQKEILCNELPTLPGDVDTQGPLQSTAQLPTARERLAPLEEGSCAGCHRLFNPTGFAFENYDAAGLWRDTENGVTIDASGEILLDGETHSFETPVELAAALADSRQVQDCYARQWYRASLGRKERPEDDCSLATLQQSMAESGGDLRDLVVALTQTDGFLYRAVAVQEGS